MNSHAPIYTMFKRELALKASAISDWLYPLVFFVLVLVIFPLAIGTDKSVLANIAVPIVWVASLFSILQSSSQLFKAEHQNGVLAQLLVAKISITVWVMVKLLVHWLSTGLVLAVVSALVVPLYGLDVQWFGLLFLSLLLATPVLVLLSALASVLTLNMPSAQALITLIAIPLQLPIIILAISVIKSAQLQMPTLPLFALLLACLIMAISVIPLTIRYILKFMYA